MRRDKVGERVRTAADVNPRGATNTQERMARLRSIAWLLDNSIPLPGGYRIGIESVIGLIPGVGDAIGAVLSAYIVNEARALGAPRSVLLRMTGNIMLETVIGAVPIVGDLFDMGFKANMRNLALLDRYTLDPTRSRRDSRWFVAGFGVAMLLIILLIVALPILIIAGLIQLF